MDEIGKETGVEAPRLRFPEFQELWQPTTVGDFFDLNTKPEKAEFFDREKLLTVKLHAKGIVKNDKSTLTGGATYFLRKSGQFIFSKIDLLNGAFGIVPESLDGFSSSTDVPAFSFKADHSAKFFLNWLIANYERLVIERTGTSNTLKRVSPDELLALPLLAPKPAEQLKIADCLTSIDEVIAAQGQKLESMMAHKRGLSQQLFPRAGQSEPDLRFAPNGARDWLPRKMSDLLQRVSKPVDIDADRQYREIGVRSHGKGIFHKAPVSGKQIGKKRVFWVVPDALVVNIVFGWEQAVATTSSLENGMIASHRFPMYLGKPGKCDVAFLSRALLTPNGKHLLSLASPGGAGRNRTLGQSEFERIEILVPEDVKEQERIAACLSAVDAQIGLELEKLKEFKAHKHGLMQQLFPFPERHQ